MLQGSQQAVGQLVLIVFLGSGAASTFSLGASLESSANFTVLAPNARLADKVVAQAESFRSRIGAVWLEEVLPATRTPTSIFVEIDDSKSLARTLPSPSGEGHMVWLVGSEQAVAGRLLEHELVHVVLGSRFPNAMPDWANEGVASRYDNQRRLKLRQQKLREFAQQESWPDLDKLFQAPIRQPWQYATAESVSDFLIRLSGPKQFLAFAADSNQGAAQALQAHYGIDSVTELEVRWRENVRQSTASPQVASVSEGELSSAHFVR